jgi:competence protein ComEC
MISLLALCLSVLAGTVKVHVMDVGQGDAVLIEAPGGKTVLIDAGTGKANVADKLKQRGIKAIDLVVATHPHADHIGGMSEVLKTFDVGRYMDNGMTHTTLTYARAMGVVDRQGIGYLAAVNGRSFQLGDEVKMTVIHPRSTLLKGTRSDLNSNSVVIRLEHKDVCFLFTGDAETPTERDMLNRGIGSCDVLKVAHHGSEHSSTSAFLRAVKPRFAAISAGANNRYGHPDPEALSRLHHAGVEVHRTDQEGTITFISDGKTLTVQTERTGDDPFSGAKADTDVLATAGALGPVVNINTADAQMLDTLPGVGPSRAATILTHRKHNGPFKSCDALTEIYGIGPKTVDGLRSRCAVAQPAGDTP